MKLVELAKYLAYRTPIARKLMAPGYDYKVCPGQLAAMIGFIDATRGTDAAVVEVGVARGQTSLFLLEHLRSTGDTRPLYLVDTFDGFTADSVAVETGQRGKVASEFDRFRYVSAALLDRDLRAAGHHNFVVVKADAAKFDWSVLGSIGAMLLDVDLYQPTAAVLFATDNMIAPGGGIVVDDCRPGTSDDGAHQAYVEHLARHGGVFHRVGFKGGIVDHATRTRSAPEELYTSPIPTPAAAAAVSSAAPT